MVTAADKANLDPYLGGLFVRNASSLVALLFVLCEHVQSLDEEIRYIWRSPMNRVRWIYFFSRYLALTALLVNVVLLFAGPLSTTANVAHCRAWFTLLAVVSCFILFSIDAVAMLRVYALYNRNAKVGALFSSLILTEATLVVTCSSRTIGVVPFSPICDVEETPLQVVYFASGVIITQCTLMFCTFQKRRSMAGQRHIPILRLVFREGAWISSLVCCIFCFTIPYSIITGTAKPHLVLVWPTALLSVAACRVILNMQQLPSPRRSGRTPASRVTDTAIEFTSFFDLSESLEYSENGHLRTHDTHSLPATDSLSTLSLGGSTRSSSRPASSVSTAGRILLGPEFRTGEPDNP